MKADWLRCPVRAASAALFRFGVEIQVVSRDQKAILGQRPENTSSTCFDGPAPFSNGSVEGERIDRGRRGRNDRGDADVDVRLSRFSLPPSDGPRLVGEAERRLGETGGAHAAACGSLARLLFERVAEEDVTAANVEDLTA